MKCSNHKKCSTCMRQIGYPCRVQKHICLPKTPLHCILSSFLRQSKFAFRCLKNCLPSDVEGTTNAGAAVLIFYFQVHPA